MRKKVLFLTLKVFSEVGGIEKVCRIAGKALQEIGLQENIRVAVWSLHDRQSDAAGNPYFPCSIFRGYGGRRIRFIFNCIKAGKKAEIVMISHINLLVVAYLIRLFNPSVKLIMLAHGIEVWHDFSKIQLKMLKTFHRFLPVSHYTRDKMAELTRLPLENFTVLNNCLDPLMPILLSTAKDPVLMKRYGFSHTDYILLTVSRLNAKERYKGYDHVINAMEGLVKGYPNLRYLIVGKYDEEEKQNLEKIIIRQKLDKHIVLTGFVSVDELAAHFNLADIYIMPSTKEGFGIVFIEAMYYGKPVIAGNQDGSVDALANGEFGILVDPSHVEEIKAAIQQLLKEPDKYIPTREKLLEKFGYTGYKQRLKSILLEG